MVQHIASAFLDFSVPHPSTRCFCQARQQNWRRRAVWFAREEKSPAVIHTNTLRAPLFELESDEGQWKEPDLWEDYGLLCLERSLPPDIAECLEILSRTVRPFKAQALRGKGNEWTTSLTLGLRFGRQSQSEHNETAERRLPSAKDDVLEGIQESDGQRRTGKGMRGPNGEVKEANMSENSYNDYLAALRWLQLDIERVATVFANEIGRLPPNDPVDFPSSGSEEGVEITAKLELLKRAKCPRFHLDKVPLRLICTYVGPGTDWLDAYDKRAMEHNRSPPPACNKKISLGQDARRAQAGHVLIFRGQAKGSGSDARAVAHRSPDMTEDQRRLVLTMDMGNIIDEIPTVEQ